jgi:leucyl-tRNA synthetase
LRPHDSRLSQQEGVVAKIAETPEGKEWLDRETGKLWKMSGKKEPHWTHPDMPGDFKVVVVGEKLVNFVSPKVKKIKEESEQAERKEEIKTQEEKKVGE